MRKIPRKFVEKEGVIWNNFCNCNFFWFSSDFELSKRFQVKIGLTEMWSYKLIATPFSNPGELHFEQGVHHYDLQSFLYNMVDMHHLTPNIQEVMTFPNWLSVKQNLQKLLSLNSGLHSHIWALGTIVSPAPNFMQICTLVDHDIRNKFSFGSGD